MSRFFGSRRNALITLASAVTISLVAYLAYEVYQESKDEHDGTDNDDTQQDHADEAVMLEHVEEVIQIAESMPTSPVAASPPKLKRRLAISARGILFNSSNPSDKWSADIDINPQARMALARLASLYELYVVVVVRSDDDKQQIIRALENAGILETTIGDSTVWVDSESQRSSISDAPSSEISAILNSSSSIPPPSPTRRTGLMSASNVLFCQTEEGKAHLVRHLLTLNGASKFTRPRAHAGYAGYIDTNHDVVNHLAGVLHSVTHVVPGAPTATLISRGEVPGMLTAYTKTDDNPAPAASAGPSSVSKSVEVVSDIAESTLYL
ncbi:hypothetical protein DL89DRAFT_267585 [Linderina pennispora]|uniref:Uncharacterized protein n=1 Tax=Linderina pennispora TaxID=61395 RepID=A0A1Y1WA14_9FUNG|nr:uncharacterized protein DL89DRAFT_267585 [Linderina pennispora]ORX70363.1 hypothetical protein DL89DRAFT_267585 [Linderina pennispora]